MKFCKMNGIGNDFIIIDNRKMRKDETALSQMASRLCERHLSIGADGLIAVEEAQGEADFRMRFFNADGSIGEMCGNGARCICRYGYENGLAGEKQKIETDAGFVTGERISRRCYRIRMNRPSVVRFDMEAEAGGKIYSCDYVELGSPGVPHAAVFYQNLLEADQDALRELGRALRHSSVFPKGANINFYDILGDNTVLEQTFERGVEDFTYACGSGSASVALILTMKNLMDGCGIKLVMKGGELTVNIEKGEDIDPFVKNIFLTGLTNLVATGEITDEEL